MSVVMFLLVLGAALRLSRLVVEDSITKPGRDAVAKFGYAHEPARPLKPLRFVARWLTQLFECYWCTGFWASCGLTALAANYPSSTWLFWPLVALTVSWLVGFVSTVLATIEAAN